MNKRNTLLGLVAICLLSAFCGAADDLPDDRMKPETEHEKMVNPPPHTLLREWNFNEEGSFDKNGVPVGWHIGTWGAKDCSVGAGEGYGGKGKSLKINVRGLSAGELQFFSIPWTMWQKRYYRLSFKAKGLDHPGKIGVTVRKYGYPWSMLGWRNISFHPENDWKEYSLVMESKHDVTAGFGVMISTGDVGAFLIDDIKIEEFLENPAGEKKLNTNKLKKGNLIPRGSAEAQSDCFFADLYIDSEIKPIWKDPRRQRAENGKFGKYCMFYPKLVIPDYKGHVRQIETSSIKIPVASGYKYTFSAYFKTDSPSCPVSFEVRYPGAKNGKTIWLKNTWDWIRLHTTTEEIPQDVDHVNLVISPNSHASFYVDGLQFEAGDKPSEFTPAHPYELDLSFDTDTPDLTPKIVRWGEKLPLKLTAYSAADANNAKEIPVTLRITAYPDEVVLKQKISLKAGLTQTIQVEPHANGILRIELIPDNPALAAIAENVMARLPEPRKTGVESYFGTHFRICPYFINYCRAIGIKWQRLHDCSNIVKMKWGNPEPGVYQWGDEQIDAIRSAGIHILGMPDYPASWIIKKEVTDQNDASGKPVVRYTYDAHAFRNWCEKAAEHYKGKIDYWEIWNEPWIDYFFKGTRKEFGKIFNAGADGIRKGNPNAKILGWCTEITHPQFTEEFMRDYSFEKKPDYTTFHSYFTNVPGDGNISFAETLKINRDYFKEYAGKEFWNTEGNLALNHSFYSFRGTPHDNDTGVAFGVRGWSESIQGGMGKVFIYTMHNTDALKNGGLMSLIDYDRSVTPKAVATAVTAWFIDGLKPTPVSEFKGIRRSAFSGNGRVTLILWDDILIPGKIELDFRKLPKNYRIYDAMGNDLREKGLQTKILERIPIFIAAEDITPEILAHTTYNALEERKKDSDHPGE